MPFVNVIFVSVHSYNKIGHKRQPYNIAPEYIVKKSVCVCVCVCCKSFQQSLAPNRSPSFLANFGIRVTLCYSMHIRHMYIHTSFSSILPICAHYR